MTIGYNPMRAAQLSPMRRSDTAGAPSLGLGRSPASRSRSPAPPLLPDQTESVASVGI